MRKIALLSVLAYTCLQAGAQVSTVQQLGAIPATQPASGLGFNVDAPVTWEYQQAAAAGAKHVRFGCAWGDAVGGRGGGAELQSPAPSNTSQGYVLSANCAQALENAKQYGLTADITASYGPPYQQILAVTASANAGVGATSVQVSFNSGSGGLTLSSIKFPTDYLYGAANYGEISYKHSYPGTLITSVTMNGANSATIHLSSALQVSISAGTALKVNRVLYPSAATNSPSDASIQAYVGYVKFLGSQCSAKGVTCQIGIWNEPAWPDDCWDNRSDCYDNNPGLNEQNYGANWGFVAALQGTTAPSGVTYSWAGTDKSGDSSVLGSDLQQYTGVSFFESNNPIKAQTFHPYGNNPEDNMWNYPCAEALPSGTNSWTACNVLSYSTSNGAEIPIRTLTAQKANSSFSLDFDIGETGFSMAYGDAAHQARYIMRQFLGYMGADMKVIDFMDLYDCNQDFGFLNRAYNSDGSCNTNPTSSNAGTPRAVYTAISGLESELAGINNAPVTSYSTSTLSSVSSYSGTYPLAVLHIVGAKSGAKGNSDLVTLWQLSNCPGGNTCWAKLGSPVGGPVVLTIPSGSQVASVINLDTRASVSYTVSGQKVSFSASDDPIGVLVQPSSTASTSTTKPSTQLSLTATTSGTQTMFSAKLTPYNTSSASTNGENIFFYDGSTTLGHAALASGVATLTVNTSTLPTGTSTVLSTYGGDGTFGASTGVASAKH